MIPMGDLNGTVVDITSTDEASVVSALSSEGCAESGTKKMKNKRKALRSDEMEDEINALKAEIKRLRSLQQPATESRKRKRRRAC